MPSHVKLENMRAVGMHHWGPPALDIESMYSLTWEPECRQDPGNAVAIYDCDHIKRAYLTRDDAKIVSTIISKGYPRSCFVALKPVSEAHCVSQHLGPQHECDIWFKTDCYVFSLAKYLSIYGVKFTIK